MLAISEVRSETWSARSVRRAITSANSSAYVKLPSTRSSLSMIAICSRPARPPPTTTTVPSGVAAADATQVNVHGYLIFAGRRIFPALEASLAIVSQHHRQHLARSAGGGLV